MFALHPKFIRCLWSASRPSPSLGGDRDRCADSVYERLAYRHDRVR